MSVLSRCWARRRTRTTTSTQSMPPNNFRCGPARMHVYEHNTELCSHLDLGLVFVKCPIYSNLLPSPPTCGRCVGICVNNLRLVPFFVLHVSSIGEFGALEYHTPSFSESNRISYDFHCDPFQLSLFFIIST